MHVNDDLLRLPHQVPELARSDHIEIGVFRERLARRIDQLEPFRVELRRPVEVAGDERAEPGMFDAAQRLPGVRIQGLIRQSRTRWRARPPVPDHLDPVLIQEQYADGLTSTMRSVHRRIRRAFPTSWRFTRGDPRCVLIQKQHADAPTGRPASGRARQASRIFQKLSLRAILPSSATSRCRSRGHRPEPRQPSCR